MNGKEFDDEIAVWAARVMDVEKTTRHGFTGRDRIKVSALVLLERISDQLGELIEVMSNK